MGHARSLESDQRLRPSAFILLPFFLISAFLTLLRKTGKQRSQAIHAHWVLPNGLVAALVSKLRNLPLVISLHGSDIYVAKGNPLFRGISRWIFSHACVVTACSPELKEEAIRLGAPEDTVLLPWGADPDLFTPKPVNTSNFSAQPGKVTVSGVGRFVNKKGFHRLIEAFALVLQEYRDVELILAGDGPQRANLINLTVSHGLNPFISFPGKIPWDQMPNFLANTYIFTLPSIRDEHGNVDGLPTVLLEAMSCGLAVVASDIGGTNLVISDGVNGLLVPPGDVEVLAHALLRLIKDTDLRLKLARSARNSVINQFNWNSVAHRLADLINQAAVR